MEKTINHWATFFNVAAAALLGIDWLWNKVNWNRIWMSICFPGVSLKRIYVFYCLNDDFIDLFESGTQMHSTCCEKWM